MSFHINDKKGKNKLTGNSGTKSAGAGNSKFIKTAASSKSAGAAKKVRSTGANRGS